MPQEQDTVPGFEPGHCFTLAYTIVDTKGLQAGVETAYVYTNINDVVKTAPSTTTRLTNHLLSAMQGQRASIHVDTTGTRENRLTET